MTDVAVALLRVCPHEIPPGNRVRAVRANDIRTRNARYKEQDSATSPPNSAYDHLEQGSHPCQRFCHSHLVFNRTESQHMRESSKPADEHNAAAIAASRALPDSTIPRGTFAHPAAPSDKGAALLTR